MKREKTISLLAAIPFLTLLLTPKLAAQPITSANDGTGTVIQQQGNQFQIQGGTLDRNGQNLFHSFQKFGLNQQQIANFLSQPDIRNILGRVVGGDASYINGLIQVSGSNANLFLTNPAGIIFGANASLNVPGDFSASTATSIGFGNNNWFNVFSSNDYQHLNGNPAEYIFNLQQPGAVINFGDLALNPGQDLTLLGGTVINLGTIEAPGGTVTIAAIPGSNLIRISQAGNLLSLEVELPLDEEGNLVPLALADVPALIQGEGGLGVNETNQLQLANSDIGINSGDVVVGNVSGERILAQGERNLTLVESEVVGTGDVTLSAKDTVLIRDSDINPVGVFAGGDLEIKGNSLVDILALNHSETPFISLGNLSLISGGYISGDSHFASGGTFSILNLEGNPGQFVSLFDPIISSVGDVSFGDYTGVSLKVESQGSITAEGNISITGPDVGLTGDDPDIATLTESPALILRAGVVELANEPNLPLESEIEEQGTIFTSSDTTSDPATVDVLGDINVPDGPVIISAPGDVNLEGNIATGGGDVEIESGGAVQLPDSNSSLEITTSGGNITIQGESVTTIGSFTNLFSNEELLGIYGDITITATGGDIDLSSSGNITSNENPSVEGEINLTATGNITAGILSGQNVVIGGDIQPIDVSLVGITLYGADFTLTNTGNTTITGLIENGGGSGNVDINSAGSVITASVITEGGNVDINSAGLVQLADDNNSSLEITTSGGNITIQGESFTTTESSTNLSSNNEELGIYGDIAITATGGEIDLGVFGDITSNLSSSTEGNINLTATGNITAGIVSGQNVVIGGDGDTQPTDVSLAGVITNGTDFSLTNTGDTTIIGAVETVGGNVDLNSGSATITGGAVDTGGGNFNLDSSGVVLLPDSSNLAEGEGISTSGGNITIRGESVSSFSQNYTNLSSNNQGGTSGDITITATEGDIDLGSFGDITSNLSSSTEGNINLTATGSITAGTISGQNVVIGGDGDNQPTDVSLEGIITNGTDFSLTNTGDTSIIGAVQTGGGNVDINSGSARITGGAVDTGGGNFNLDSSGVVLLPDSSNLAEGEGITTSGGNITIRGESVSSFSQNYTNLSSNNEELGIYGDIAITATGGEIDLGVFGDITSNLSSSTEGNINLTATGNITAGIVSGQNVVIGGDGDTQPTDVSLAGVITNGTDFSLTNTGDTTIIGAVETVGGNVDLNSGSATITGGAVDTGGGNFNLDSSGVVLLPDSSNLAEGEGITTSGGNITIRGESVSSFSQNYTNLSSNNQGGTSGDITITATAGDIDLGSSGDITSNLSSSTEGNINLTATGSITAGTISGQNVVIGSSENQPVDVSLAGIITNGTDFSLTNTGATTITGAVETVGGNVDLNSGSATITGGAVDTGGGNFNLDSSGVVLLPDSSNLAEGEGISTSGGNITIRGESVSSFSQNYTNLSSNNQGGTSGDITITSTAGNINLGSSGTIDTSSTNSDGGNVTITTLDGNIIPTRITTASSGDDTTGGTIDLSQAPIEGSGIVNLNAGTGDVLLNTVGETEPVSTVNVIGENIEVVAISSTGDMAITANQFFTATGAITETNSSLTTTNGDITITHGGNGGTPFIVGDSRVNGTFGAIATSTETVEPVQSYSDSFISDNGTIQILTVIQPIVAAADGIGSIVSTSDSITFNLTGGTVTGNNLFHSYSRFDLPDSAQVASFNISPSVENILARVSSGDASIIEGTLEVTGGNNANLYFMNPAGVLFGSGAQLNLTGDLIVTTANGIGFEDGSFFDAAGGTPSLSSINTPVNLAFTTTEPGAIVTEVLNVLNVQHKNKPNCDIISHVFDFNLLITMLYPFPKLVKSILRDLPKNDYPVLNTNKFVSCWLGYSLDKSLTSMRDLFQRLNYAGINMHISTFSKASKQRSLEPFIKIYQKLNDKIESKEAEKGYLICPIDSTIVTLTSKLLLNNGYGQVKLISGLNLSTGVTEDNLVNFGYDHDYKYGQEMIDALPRNGVAVMDRGFASLDFMKKSSGKNKYFVIRIPCNYKLEFVENAELTKVGTGQKSGAYRVVNFGDLEKHTEYRLVTNLPIRGEGRITNEEIGEIYRRRWGIECLWKFLKMHLKLDKLITKNVNGISIQIYSTLIAYLIIKLVEIPEEWGVSLLDKLRFLQACMCREISYIHWFRKIVFF